MKRTNERARFHFQRLHIPTGSLHESAVVCDGRAEFLERLSKWNREGSGTWAYWLTEKPPEPLAPDEWDQYERPQSGAQLLKKWQRWPED